MIVTPATVLRWQRRRFRDYWTELSSPPAGGRPVIQAEINALIAWMATVSRLEDSRYKRSGGSTISLPGGSQVARIGSWTKFAARLDENATLEIVPVS